MSKSVIKVVNLSKVYQIGQVGTGIILHDLEHFLLLKFTRRSLFFKNRETNTLIIKIYNDIIASMKDVNFEINQGEVFGVNGKNVVGKLKKKEYA